MGQPILDAVQRYAEAYEVITRTCEGSPHLDARRYATQAAWEEVEMEVGAVLNRLARIESAAIPLVYDARPYYAAFGVTDNHRSVSVGNLDRLRTALEREDEGIGTAACPSCDGHPSGDYGTEACARCGGSGSIAVDQNGDPIGDETQAAPDPLPTKRELIAAIERYGALRVNASPLAAAVLQGIEELLADVYDVLDALDTVQ